MSYTTDVRDAISAAIAEADPTCPAANIHNRLRVPRDTSFDTVKSLYGDKNAASKDIIHGWQFTRTSSNELETVAEDGIQSIVRTEESWLIEGYYSFKDGSLPNETEADATEPTWQALIDTLSNKLRSNSAINNLETKYGCYLQTVSLQAIGLDYRIVKEHYCHYATIIVRFWHEDHLAT